MNLVRVRISFLFWLSFACAGFFGLKAYKAYVTLNASYAELQQSMDLKAYLLEVNPDTFNREVKFTLQDMRKNIQGPNRSESLSDLIQAYSNQDQRLFKMRREVVLDGEKSFFKKKSAELDFYQKRFLFNILIGLIIPLTGYLLTVVYVNVSVFKQIRRLTNRMMDFLVDRYSFQFSQPANNELGALQRTFNSLAQRSINNMDELKSLDQAKSEFLSIASHELRTPMTSIKGSLALLAAGFAGPIDPSAKKLIEIAEHETDRLIRLINDLLDLAKIEARRLPLNLQWVSWRTAASTIAEGLTAFAYNAKVQLVFEASVDYNLHIDQDRIQQVLTNLISNAVKFSPEGGHVFIRPVEHPTGPLEFQIQDEGPGINAEDQELIFQKFRQAANAENPVVKGTGLGLAIAKALVEEHKGTIGVISKRGHGATFFFTLPEWRLPDEVPAVLEVAPAKAA